MTMTSHTRPLSRLLAALALVSLPLPASAQRAPARLLVTAQPATGDAEAMRHAVDPARRPMLSRAAMATLMRRRIKYVFVIFHENESFDHEYGTFPGADGLYCGQGRAPRGAARTPGLVQSYVDSSTAGARVSVRPFRLGPAAERDGDGQRRPQSHGFGPPSSTSTDGTARMDGFAQTEFSGKSGPAKTRGPGRRAAGNMPIWSCPISTATRIPFFWRYANRFTIFDNIFATEDTPSTPNAIAMIAGQAGETQWVKHGTARLRTGRDRRHGQRPDAYAGHRHHCKGCRWLAIQTRIWGSQFDPGGPPRRADLAQGAATVIAASRALQRLGQPHLRDRAARSRWASGIRRYRSPVTAIRPTNQADIQGDIPAIAASGHAPVAWRWYQNGYDHEPSDPPGIATPRQFRRASRGAAIFRLSRRQQRRRAHVAARRGRLLRRRRRRQAAAGRGRHLHPRWLRQSRSTWTPPIQNAALTPPG